MLIAKKYLWFVLIVALLGTLAACNLGVATPPPTADPNLIHTQAAEAVRATLTAAAFGVPMVVPTQTPAVIPPSATFPPPPPLATATPLPPTATPFPTATPLPPTATPVPIPCDWAGFVKDVTYDDSTSTPEVAAGSTFVKTWRLKNIGTCTWTSGYALIFERGDAMGGPASQQLTTSTVAPGQEIDISVTLKAPDTAGTYQGFWKLRNSAGATFGLGSNYNQPFWVKVKVVIPVTPTPTAVMHFNFLDKAPGAEWRNATTPLPWGDPNDDSPGVAAYLENIKLENGKTYSKVLATYPQRITDGVITGLFASYTVQDGDHFRATIGFGKSCGVGKVKFQLNYKEGDTLVNLREWSESCDGKLLDVDVDLSTLVGKTVQFMLAVTTDGSPDDDNAIWVAPRIEK